MAIGGNFRVLTGKHSDISGIRLEVNQQEIIGRSWLHCRLRYLSEADVVGGNRHLKFSPPGKVWFTGG